MPRRATGPPSIDMGPPPPPFDGQRFARELRAVMRAQGLTQAELSRRAGLGASTVHNLTHGDVRGIAKQRGQRSMSYYIDTFVAVAHGLQLPLGFVLSWAGIDNDGDRWRAFAASERSKLVAALGGSDGDDLNSLLRNWSPERSHEREEQDPCRVP